MSPANWVVVADGVELGQPTAELLSFWLRRRAARESPVYVAQVQPGEWALLTTESLAGSRVERARLVEVSP